MADDNYFMGLDGFVWFTGVVEDRNDPAKLGRVRVRCLGLHTEDKNEIPTDALPWAHIMHPVHDPSMQGMGTTPSFLVEGTWVIGFFRDVQDKQQPIIMGTLPGYPQVPDDIGDDKSVEAIREYRENDEKGFTDPNKKYPQYPNDKSGHDLGESDVNRLARGDANYIHQILEDKKSAAENFTDVETAQSGNFSMPYENSTNFTTYPYNHVFESESGHIREYDDTFNEERIQEYHRSGTFYEIDSGGNKVVHIVGDNYEFIAGSDFVNVKGDVNITVEGNAEVLVKEDYNIRCKNLNIEVENDFNTTVTGDTKQLYKSKLITTVLGPVSSVYNETLDSVIIGAVTDTYGATIDRSITGDVTERFGATLNRYIVGIQTDIHDAEFNINSTAGGVNINSVDEIKLFSTEVDLKASSGITLDASDINLNSGTKGAARLDDTAIGTDTAGLGAGTVNSTINSASATVKIGSADPGIGDIAVEASELIVTNITKVIENGENIVEEESLVDAQGPDRTEDGGTGGYASNAEGDYPLPILLTVPDIEVVKTEIEEQGIDTTNLSVAQQKQTHKDVVTDTVAKYYPEKSGTPEGDEKINEGNDPKSFEVEEKLPPVTAGEEDTNQNQYRSYLGVPTEGKTFGDVFDESEVTDDIRGRYTNKYFPSDYRIPQLRGLPRLKIKLNAGVTLTGTSPKVLEIAEKIAFDLGKQLTINSAYRSGEANRRCGGASGSKHLEGLALDVRTVGYTNSEKVEYVRLAIEHGALAFGFYNRFIHFDIHSKRNWGSIPSRYRATLKAGKISPYKNG